MTQEIFMKRLLLAHLILIFQFNLKAASFEPAAFKSSDPSIFEDDEGFYEDDEDLDFPDALPHNKVFQSLSPVRTGLGFGHPPQSSTPIPLKSEYLGSGTHGSVVFYDKTPHLCSKKIPKREDFSNELEIHGLVHRLLSDLGDPHIAAPELVKIKEDSEYNYIVMSRILPYLEEDNKLLQLTWNFPVEYKSEDSQGIYLGLSAFEKHADSMPALEEITVKMAKIYAVLHNSGIDAYDMEFVLSHNEDRSSWVVYVYDFDKCSFIGTDTENSDMTIKRKIAESTYEDIRRRRTILASSIAYFPIRRDLYELFKNSYMEQRQEQIEDARKIIEFHEQLYDFED